MLSLWSSRQSKSILTTSWALFLMSFHSVRSAMSTLSQQNYAAAVFSDLDGTLLHYPKHFLKHDVEVVHEDEKGHVGVLRGKDGDLRTCRLFQSSTLGHGFMSMRTFELIEQIRRRGTKFAIVSGARSSTMLNRLPLLPLVDAVICETGSRICYPRVSSSDPDAPVQWVLDEAWCDALSDVAGSYSSSPDPPPPPELRHGPLWDLYRCLASHGLSIDARGYFASFRVHCQTDADAQLLESERARHGGAIACACNLGHYDLFAAAAGKGNAVRHLQRLWAAEPDASVALFDDDNDLPMAEQCARRLVVSVTSDSIARAVAARRPGWLCAAACGQGVFATEEALARILDGRFDSDADCEPGPARGQEVRDDCDEEVCGQQGPAPAVSQELELATAAAAAAATASAWPAVAGVAGGD